jgi:hypothetical protein
VGDEVTFNMGTHCYVGQLACGCGVALVRDMPDYKKDTAESVAQMVKDGYEVQRLPHEQACDAFAAKCSAYPHEAWQLRLEADIKDAQVTAK